jgi:hypothetical protein
MYRFVDLFPRPGLCAGAGKLIIFITEFGSSQLKVISYFLLISYL